METSATLKSQHCCAFKINQAETATRGPTYHLRIILQILFYQAHLQGEHERLIILRESIPRKRQSSSPYIALARAAVVLYVSVNAQNP